MFSETQTLPDRTGDAFANMLEGLTIDSNYKGPHLTFPLTLNQLHKMVQAFKRKLVRRH